MTGTRKTQMAAEKSSTYFWGVKMSLQDDYDDNDDNTDFRKL